MYKFWCHTKRFLFVLSILLVGLLSSSKGAIAVVDPTLVDNNKIGIHILAPSELVEASKLVNGENGEWGYVTVPIQATDRDRSKWVTFMDEAKQYRVIPIIRVATLVTNVNWEEPNNYDLVDFANFLNDLPCPTKNRYVIIFNEVNRADEFGGYVSPEKYAEILENAITIFKERSEDFFILPAGLDNAAANNGGAVYWRDYWRRVFQHRPDLVERIDGWTSHSYANPGFVGTPYEIHERSVAGYLHELRLVAQFTSRKLSVFITETGWDMERLGDERVSGYFREAFLRSWSNPNVVAVTPFLLHAGGGPFVKFSFVNMDGSPKRTYDVWRSMATVGRPVLAEDKVVEVPNDYTSLPKPVADKNERLSWWGEWKDLWGVLMRMFGVESEKLNLEKKVKVGEKTYDVALADDNEERQKGLAGVWGMSENEGMLFLFDGAGKKVFWMKDMKMDIDIVWIRESKVVGVSKGYDEEPKVRIRSGEEVDMVLEVNMDSGIKIGEEVEVLE